MKNLLVLFTLVFVISCRQRPKNNVAFYISTLTPPQTLNPITATDGGANFVHGYIMENLLSRNIETYDWEPALAESWEVSKDGKQYTFKLREGVTFHDGTPLTVEDVKWSFDVIFDDKWNTAVMRPFYEGIEKVEILDKRTVRFYTKNTYYKNFDVAAGLTVYPRKYYEKGLKKSVYNKTVFGTGPYKLDYYQRAKKLVLKRNPNWWGFKDKNQKEHNYEKVVIRFITQRNIVLESLKKGIIDYSSLRPDEYEKNTSGPPWGETVHKVLTENNTPKGYNFIGWNMLHPILKSKKVRKALFHLVNRRELIDKFEYGYSVPAKSPVYPSSPYHNADLPIIEYDPKEALRLLRSEGWSDTNGDNILDKVIDGKRRKMSITILEPYAPFSKYLTVFKEDAKKVGVEINIKVIEWNSFLKLLDEKKFDALRMAWGANSIDWDPNQIWHTNSAKGGSNFISYSNKEADRLIEKARNTLDRDKRIKMMKRVQKLIAEDYPYVWYTFKPKSMYGYNDRILREKDTYKYGIGSSFWKFKNKKRVE
jgi:ABC-type transport system substrate-binding protein